MSSLGIKHDNSSLVHLKQNHVLGWIFALMGAGLCYLPQTNIESNGPVWVAYVVGGMFALIGLGVAFYRLEVKLFLTQRRFEVIKGYWPNPNKYNGSFDQLEGLFYEKKWQSSGGKSNTKYLVWRTGLKLKELKRAITLFESKDEQQGRAYFEKRAKQLRIPTFDHTGESVVSRNWDQLDQSVSEQVQEKVFDVVSDISPPAGLEYKASSRGISYWTREPGLNAISVIGTLFGLPFFLMGIAAMLIGLDLDQALGWNIQKSGSMTAAVITGAVFTLIGGFIIKVSIGYAFTRHGFTFGSREFIHETYQYGKPSKKTSFKLSEIEDFGVRESTASRGNNNIKIGGTEVRRHNKPRKPELFIRTDKKVTTIRDMDLECAEYINNLFYQRLRKQQF
ncbi:hypothetical protein QP938_00030 [Porticoccaceae bacterium LTM1]|nr:hypothetical protein QP938_00030 [Porticoccaceae bacterium LTM1]